jgi:signal transduction histidine kinase
MNLLTRLSLAVLLVCLGFGAVFWFAHRQAVRDIDQLTASLGKERAQRLEVATNLLGRGLEALVSSYAWWDDMVKFMDKPDEKWAAENIDNIVGIPNGGDAVWVLDPDLRLLHTINKDYGRPAPPFASPGELRAILDRRYTFRYFTMVDGKLWEIFGAAIQDANFWRSETPVRGYLLLGKEWDDPWIAQLNTLVGARITLHPPEAGHDHRGHHRVINGIDGRPILHLHAHFNFDLIREVEAAYGRQTLSVGLGALFALALLIVLVGFMVLRPLGQLTRSLETRLPTPIAGLLTARNEFGEIARLLAGQLRWGQMLQEEIRRTLERSNPEALRRDAESNEALRLRLAGNLHDGPIQSIYAAGLQLSALEADVQHGRPPTPEQLTHIKAMLQQASADLRNLILDLEPEELRDRDLDAALHRIERHMRQFARCDFQLKIAEGALDGLTRAAQTSLYFICRELASNALRHARPAAASLVFGIDSGFLRVEWLNDGVAPGRPAPAAGQGLGNIRRRVEDLGGAVRHGPHRADGWRVAFEIPFTSLTSPAHPV